MSTILETVKNTIREAEGLSATNVSFSYGGKAVLSDVSLLVGEGEFVALLGPSGSGKTTFLRLLAGLEKPQKGRIAWKTRAITEPSLERGVVFQDYSLFPWMTLSQNVELALAKAQPKSPRWWRKELAGQYLDLVGLVADAGKHPYELSGGMRQRGAIARTLALGSPVLLMDEPFGALDPVNRAKLQDLLIEVWRDAHPRKTVVFVTHDIDEALLLADRIVVLGANPGRVIDEVTVTAPRPRGRKLISQSPSFSALKRRIEERFHEDVLDRIQGDSLVRTPAEGI